MQGAGTSGGLLGPPPLQGFGGAEKDERRIAIVKRDRKKTDRKRKDDIEKSGHLVSCVVGRVFGSGRPGYLSSRGTPGPRALLSDWTTRYTLLGWL